VQEAYIHGVSTRKVDELVESLGMKGISKSEVSRICKELDDVVLWEKAQVIANSRATGIPRRYTGSFPLTGLVKCPQCGSFMTSLLGARNKDGKRKRYYVCGAYHNHGKAICKPNLIPADWLEEAVYERLEKSLQSEDILQEITNQLNALIHHNHQEHETEVEILENKLADLEARKKKIQEEFEKGSGLYTESEAYERMAEIRKSIEEIKNALASIEHSNRSVDPWQKKTVTVDQVRCQDRLKIPQNNRLKIPQ